MQANRGYRSWCGAGALGCLIAATLVARSAHAQEAPGSWGAGQGNGQAMPEPASAPPEPASAPPEALPEPKLKPLVPTPNQNSDVTADRPTADQDNGAGIKPPAKRILHGFRMGYLYIANYDQPTSSENPDCPHCSLKERYHMRTPHQYLLGYEVMGRIIGHDWLNVVVVGNALVSGLEQSKFWPSANMLIGFEFDQSFQVGIGPNFTLEEDKPAHIVMAAGWTPLIGSFYVPVHAFFIPDVDRNHRMGMTVGVNW